jgi:outer membrane receptor protein involved in Fe transport
MIAEPGTDMGPMKSRMWMPALLLVLALLPTAVEAQDRESIVITVTAAETGAPLAGAQVVLDGGRGAVADADGVIRLTGLAGGDHRIQVRLLGYETAEFTLRVAPGERLEINVALSIAPVEIAGVEATAEAGEPRGRALAATGFFERMDRGGGGTFLTRDEIERRNPSLMSDLFRRIPGVRVVRYDGRYNDSYALEMARGAQTMRGGGQCPVIYYFDGVQRQLSPLGLDEIRPRDIEAIEIYRGSGALPPQFRAAGSACGVVAIWTRRYRDQGH